MSHTKSKNAVFCYNNKDRSNSKFMYKNFEETDSYHTNFQNADFSYVSFRNAHMKYCDFLGACFTKTEFYGTNLRGSSFISARFNRAIFNNAILEGTNFENAVFENCYFLCTGISSAKRFTSDRSGIIFLDEYPSESLFSSELILAVEGLRSNDIIRRSKILHLKERRVNTLSLEILRKEFSENELITLLPKIAIQQTLQFHTLSYLEAQLKKAKNLL